VNRWDDFKQRRKEFVDDFLAYRRDQVLVRMFIVEAMKDKVVRRASTA
jgi:hypothetical protein